ncbi:PAS domain S-box protein [Methylomonas sp. AM2-LC]|uniref:PAS domain S-box protein n=1 Tax=Methylomonas sp. AM2-LC TaxID=3153301 RepID=UPI0032678A51
MPKKSPYSAYFKLLKHLSTVPHRGFSGYFVAVLSCFAALLIRLLILPMESGLPFLTFFPAVIFAVFFGGKGPGIVALLLSTIAANYLFIPPFGYFTWFFDHTTIGSNAVFYSQVLIVMWVIEAFHKQRQNYTIVSQQLRLDQNRIKFLADNMDGFATYTIDPHGYVQSWNKGARKLLGYSKKAIYGLSSQRFFTEEDINSGLPTCIRELARRNGHYENPGWRVRKDGSCFFSKIIVSPLYDERGNLTGFVEILRDLSDQPHYEKYLQSIIQSAPMPLLMVNADAEIIMVNAYTEKLFGYQTDELTGKNFDVLVPERFREHHKNYLSEYLQNPDTRNTTVVREIKGVNQQGKEFAVHIGLCAIDLADGQLILATINPINQAKFRRRDTDLLYAGLNNNPDNAKSADILSEDIAPLIVDKASNEAPLANAASATVVQTSSESSPPPPEQVSNSSPTPGTLMPDLERAASLGLQGNQLLLKKLLFSFAANYATADRQIESLLADKHTEKAAELLHRLQSAAANLGLQALATTAQQFKNELRCAHPLNAQPEFALHLQDAVASIQQQLPADLEIATNTPADPEFILHKITELSDRLKKREVPNDSEILALNQLLFAQIDEDLLNTFAENLSAFDFSSALQTLDKITDQYKNSLSA